MRLKNDILEIEFDNLLIIILISFLFSSKIKMFLTSYFVCYLFILFHELSHILVASLFGKKIKKVKLSIAGVCAIFGNDEVDIVKNLIIYIAGPLSNFCLAGIFHNIEFIYEVNIFLGILNLVPIYPLDGYNALCCILPESFIKNIQKIFLFILFFISICVLILKGNPSLLIFFFYILLIKYSIKIM